MQMNSLVRKIVGLTEAEDYQMRPVDLDDLDQISRVFGHSLHNEPGNAVSREHYAASGKFYVIYQNGSPFLVVWISNDGNRAEVHGDLTVRNPV